MLDQPDLNSVCLSGVLVRPPDYQEPWSFCELKVLHPGGGVLFVALHVPTATYLRLLEDLSPGDRLSVSGELAYAKAAGLSHGGQTCVKVKDLQRLEAGGRRRTDAPAVEANPYGTVVARPLPRGDRPRPGSLATKRRQRRRRRRLADEGKE